MSDFAAALAATGAKTRAQLEGMYLDAGKAYLMASNAIQKDAFFQMADSYLQVLRAWDLDDIAHAATASLAPLHNKLVQVKALLKPGEGVQIFSDHKGSVVKYVKVSDKGKVLGALDTTVTLKFEQITALRSRKSRKDAMATLMRQASELSSREKRMKRVQRLVSEISSRIPPMCEMVLVSGEGYVTPDDSLAQTDYVTRRKMLLQGKLSRITEAGEIAEV